MKHLYLLLISSLLMLALSCTQITEGTVVNKHYEPASESLILMPTTISDGKSSTTIYNTFWVMDNEDWVITIKGVTEDGTPVTQRFYVSQAQYNCLKKGDYFSVTKDCSTKDNNNSKRPK